MANVVGNVVEVVGPQMARIDELEGLLVVVVVAAVVVVTNAPVVVVGHVYTPHMGGALHIAGKAGRVSAIVKEYLPFTGMLFATYSVGLAAELNGDTRVQAT